MIRWQPGYVYPPVFHPPHPPVDLVTAVFLVAAAIAAALLTVRRPSLGIAALILTAPYLDAHYAFDTSFTLPKAALLGFLAGLLVRRPRPWIVRDPALRPLLAGFGAVLVSIAFSAWHALHPSEVVREFAKWLEYAVTFGAVAVAFADDPDDRPVWTALIAIVVIESLQAFSQLLFGAPSGLFVHGTPLPRVAGSLEGPNQFSGWLNVVVPVLFARMLVHRDGWLVTAVVLGSVAQAATISRSGIVAAVVGMIVVLVVTRPPRIVGFRFALGGALLAAILVTLGLSIGLEARFFSWAEVPQPDRLGTRAILWSSALALFRLSPLTGVGAGNYELDLGMVGHPDVQTHANSLYLQSLAETGIIGFAACLVLVYGTIATFARTYSRRPIVIGLFAAGVALALHQVFDYLWFFPKIGVTWAVLLGIAVAEVATSRHDPGRLPEPV